MTPAPEEVAEIFATTHTWQARHCAVVLTDLEGNVVAQHGDMDFSFRLASVSKMMTAYALLIAHEEGSISLDDVVTGPIPTYDRLDSGIQLLTPGEHSTEPVNPGEEGPSTASRRTFYPPVGVKVRQLLAHVSGLGFDADDPLVAPLGRRRVYSNAGFEAAAYHLEHATGIDIATYLTESVFEPLGMASAQVRGSPAHAIWATAADVARFAAEVGSPMLAYPGTVADALKVAYPGLSGVVPGVGRFDPCDWGLGWERNFGKPHHWAGSAVSASAWGHFGGAGTFVVTDPTVGLTCVCLTDRPFAGWALTAWPTLVSALWSAFGAPD